MNAKDIHNRSIEIARQLAQANIGQEQGEALLTAANGLTHFVLAVSRFTNPDTTFTDNHWESLLTTISDAINEWRKENVPMV